MYQGPQLEALARKFTQAQVHQKPGRGGGSYVKHSTVAQRALHDIGSFSYEVVELFYGYAPGCYVPGTEVWEKQTNDYGKTKAVAVGGEAAKVVVGCLAKLSCVIDGVPVVITEVGDVEQPSNWKHDGARAKDAASDAIKRCFARTGLGNHLYTNEEYFLDRALKKDREANEATLTTKEES